MHLRFTVKQYPKCMACQSFQHINPLRNRLESWKKVEKYAFRVSPYKKLPRLWRAEHFNTSIVEKQMGKLKKVEKICISRFTKLKITPSMARRAFKHINPLRKIW